MLSNDLNFGFLITMPAEDLARAAKLIYDELFIEAGDSTRNNC